MLTLRARRFIWIAVGAIIVASAVALVLRAFNSNLVFFFTPSEVSQNKAPKDRTFRLGGLVTEGSVKRQPDGLTVVFAVTDTAQTIPVTFTGILPDLFKMPEKVRQYWCLNFVGLVIAAVLIAVATPVGAQLQTPELPLPAPELAQRLKKLESELRCLVCQNQTLAESPAGLAGDLRREVRMLIEQGKTDEQIKSHLQARYGDFVLYKPPVDTKTYLLWYGPFGLLIIAAAFAWRIVRRHRSTIAVPSARNDESDASQRNARALLEGDDPAKGSHT